MGFRPWFIGSVLWPNLGGILDGDRCARVDGLWSPVAILLAGKLNAREESRLKWSANSGTKLTISGSISTILRVKTG